MKLIEADGKRLLAEAGIVVPDGQFFSVDTLASMMELDWSASWFLKAQILQGHRGQTGFVQTCGSWERASHVLEDWKTRLMNVPFGGVLCERAVPHQDEWLVSIDVDRQSGQRRITVSSSGGMSVHQATSLLVRQPDDVNMIDAPSRIRDACSKLLKAFGPTDALSIEINPLAILEDGSCVALDAKVELDDAAVFRHPERSLFISLPQMNRYLTEREAAYLVMKSEGSYRGTLGNYVELDGDIAMILSGGGASLVAMDALRLAGGRPANYVELSGNPEPEAVKRAVRIVLAHPNIKAIWIAGSFANFTDIAVTVQATLDVVAESGLRVPVVVRRDGPHAEEAELIAASWSETHRIPLQFDRSRTSLEESALSVVKAKNAYAVEAV